VFPRVLARVLGFALVVAALAVSGTVWVLDKGSGAPGDAVPGIDDEIRAELFHYARAHADWGGVAPLVEDLARRTGRRIALTGADGEVIADSARLLGNGGGGPPAASSTVVDAAASLDYTAAVPEPGAGVGLAYRGFRLSEDEQRQRDALVADAIDCLRGEPGLAQASLRRFTAPGLFGGDGPPLPAMSCVPSELRTPSEFNRKLNSEAVPHAIDCLNGNGLAFEEPADGDELEWPSPPQGTAKSPEWTDCERDACAAATQGVTAPVAGLYLAAEPAKDAPNWWALAGLVFAVSVLAVLFARNLAAPMAASDGRERRRRELIGDLAHELRTPLTTVRSQLEAAEAELLPLDAALVRSLHEEAARMERLVSDMDDLGLAEAGMLRLRARLHDITVPAREALAGHLPSTGGVELRLDAPAAVRVHADPARIRQVVANLVANAVRHTPPGGTVTVSARAEGSHAVLAVADTGAGIPAEDLPHIFERFHRNGSGGSGLGLAITARIVEAHGGSIRLTSTAGAGTSVVIRLPLDLTTS